MLSFVSHPARIGAIGVGVAPARERREAPGGGLALSGVDQDVLHAPANPARAFHERRVPWKVWRAKKSAGEDGHPLPPQPFISKPFHQPLGKEGGRASCGRTKRLIGEIYVWLLKKLRTV